jgi:mRNA-degrading endonuclease toxin of MazEF toxin-antitoxin module
VPERGEVWQVDFGITQKVRPTLVISIPYSVP